jgi:PAS domain S-box-containing protein
MLGYPLDAATSKWDFFEFIHPDDRETVRGYFMHQIRDLSQPNAVRQLKALDYRLRRFDGKFIWIHAEAISITGGDGRTLRYMCSFIDITGQRTIQQTLADERERLALLVHSTKAGFSDWDSVNDVISYSDRFKEMLGYPRDADSSKWPNIFNLMHPEDREPMRAKFRDMIRRKEKPGIQEPGEPMEYRLRRADGSYVWVHAEGVAEVDPTGRTKRFISSFVDISKFREQEQRLRDQVLLTGALIDENPNAMYLKDLQGRYVTVNDAWLKMIGVTRAQAIGRNIREIFPDAESERYDAEDKRLFAAGEGSSEVESLRTGPDGKPQWLIVRKAVLRTSDGGVVGLIGTNTDITRLKRYEKELATEQRQLDLVVRAARVGIVDWDGKTHATFYSPRLREIRGYPPDADTSGWPDFFKLMIHPEDRARVSARFRDYILGTGPDGPREYIDEEACRLSRADGSHVWIQVSGICVRDEKGFATRFIAAITDITERRAQEEALRASVRLREEVERMSRHDLKTPLNSMIAMSRLLRENSKLPAEDAELLGTVERAGYRILSMVNLSLDLFRMESGTYQFRARAIDLAEVARRVAADLESQAASKNIDIRVRANGKSAATQPVMARADELLSYSMFANLVKNAIEAAPERSVVSVSLRKDNDAVLAEVHNPGAVPEEMRARFFEKYATAGKSAGLGLGTYSAHLMARVQEGELTLQSSEAQGTTLLVRLKAAAGGEAPPAGEDAAVKAVAQARGQLPALRVLVVDDDEFNRLVLRRYLPTPPLTLAMAVNGRAAIDAAERDWPDVVLLDLEMPVMDGYEAARRLRELEQRMDEHGRSEGRKRLTIVAISSNDEEAIMQRALAAGCDHYLVKPAPRDVLWRILAGAGVSSAGDSSIEGNDETARFNEADSVLLDPDLADTVAGFLDSRRKLLDEMPQALAKGDRAGFKRLAHKLTGGFALYGFGWAAAQCRAIEHDALEGDAADLGNRAAAVRAHLGSVEIRFRNGSNMDSK